MTANAHLFLDDSFSTVKRDTQGNTVGLPYRYVGRYFDVSSPMAERIDLCRCPEGMARANGMSAAMSEAQAVAIPRAVYVIGVHGEAVSKIGVSSTPINRCAGLQQSHYRELFLHGAVYLVGSTRCETLETAAIERAAEESGFRRGEWVGTTPERSFEIVMSLADELSIKVCDAATWVSNLNAKARALARTKYRRAA